jgi:hypothetical protein
MKAHQLVNQNSGNVEIYTPGFIIEAARATMGGIDLDPASSERANETVKADAFFSSGALEKQWAGRVWMNHPFSRSYNAAWITKLVQSYESGPVDEACCICFASTSEKWFRPLLGYPQCFLSPRTNYLLPDGSIYRGVTKGSVVTYFGRSVIRFYHNFKILGVVKIPFTPEYSK